MLNLSRVSLIKRLSFFQIFVISITIGATSYLLSNLITQRIEARTEDNLKQQIALVVGSIETYQAELAKNADTLNRVFLASLPGNLNLHPETMLPVGDRRAPQLTSGATVLNGNAEFVDRFSRATQAPSSIFARTGDDLVRIATSIQDESGRRMVGTVLDHASPAYSRLLQGDSFTGKANIGGRTYMISYAPLKDAQGNVVGVAAVDVDFTASLKTLADSLLKVKIGKTGYIYALDAASGSERGTLRIHPSQAGKNILASKDAHGFEFIRDLIDRKQGVTRYFWINPALGEKAPREKIVAFGYIPEWDWVVGAGSYVDELNSEGVFLRRSMLGATAFMVVLLVSLFVLMARRWISQPLQRAMQMTEVLASGDFRQIADLHGETCPTENEVELLERSIFAMAISLCELLEKVHTAAAQVTAASQAIAASARQSAETSHSQSARTTQVSAAIQDMSAAVTQVYDSSRHASDAAHAAAETARAGGGVVSETLATMRTIADSTQQVAAKITELGASSNKIGAIASVISEIAAQTNLLALNAAIEAARAGEQGRGFAVVAGEVRRLAERTTAATTEISTTIGNIQQETRSAVEAMHHENQAVALGVEKTQSSGQALDRIIEMAGRVGEMVTQIASSATLQNTAAETVNGHIGLIAEMTAQSAASATEAAHACADLSQLALGLQDAVGRFTFQNRSR